MSAKCRYSQIVSRIPDMLRKCTVGMSKLKLFESVSYRLLVACCFIVSLDSFQRFAVIVKTVLDD